MSKSAARKLTLVSGTCANPGPTPKPSTPATDRSPNPVDVHVGGRIRMRRKLLGISQESLAGDLKLTFQQVQKYERGANRVSASKLYEIAKSLGTSIAYFFEGLVDPSTAKASGVSGSGAEPFIHDFLMTPEGLELAALFPKIKSGKIRRRLLNLVRSMAEEEDTVETED